MADSITTIRTWCTLHKRAFQDALALRYGWNPKNTPTKCDCYKAFSIEHVLSCAIGGFPTIRYNEIRDLTATLLTEVCNDVCIEPNLQPITEETFRCATANTQKGARLDISANGVWGGRYEKTYFDLRVFNPHVTTNKGPLIVVGRLCQHNFEHNRHIFLVRIMLA